MSNLRQIGNAMMIYVNQSGGFFPVAPMNGSATADRIVDAVITNDGSAPGATDTASSCIKPATAC